MKYDDASWHYEGEYPTDLPPEAGATHIGMFLAWMLLHGFASSDVQEDAVAELAALQRREISGAEFLRRVCDEALTDGEFSEEGNAFATAYYQSEDGEGYGLYIDDYIATFALSDDTDDDNCLYRLNDNWDNYDKLAAVIDRRYDEWRAQGRPASYRGIEPAPTVLFLQYLRGTAFIPPDTPQV